MSPIATPKGARTRERILDAAERLFAERGYAATSLREIARAAGVHQPGLYNYYADKRALYGGVLERALRPMLDALSANLDQTSSTSRGLAELPALMTDLLAAHPRMPALFQQALRADARSPGQRLMRDWLDRLFRDGLAAMRAAGGPGGRLDEAELAIRVIAMFNLCTGYFLSERAFEAMTGRKEGKLSDPKNLERQRRLLDLFARSGMR